ncbi:MAG: hypothetical protein ACHQK9_13255 [Reyranellales bacterium]
MGEGPVRVDRRRQRSDRTRLAMIEAYLALLPDKKRMPTAEEIARYVGCSTRLVFARFGDMMELGLAAADHAHEVATAAGMPRHVDGNRAARIASHVETRALTCEGWLPLWRVAVNVQERSAGVKSRIARARDIVIKRLELMYAPELSTLPERQRRQLVIALEAIVDFESWGRMRDEQGLSVDEARTVWEQAIERMLPPTPPAAAPPRE